MPPAPDASSHGRRSRRQLSCLPSCFTFSPVHDPIDDNTIPLASRPPNSLWSRLRSHRRTVPVEETPSGDTQREESVIASAPAENQREGLPKKLRKEPKQSKSTAKSQAPWAPSGGSRVIKELRQTSVCHVVSRCNQPPTRTEKRTDHDGSPRPNRPAGSVQRAPQRVGTVYMLLLLAMALAVIIFFGRLIAVFCTCGWFYLVPFGRPSPAEPSEMVPAVTVDVDSAEHKKKVVLMGLLERDRSRAPGIRLTPISSPARMR
ncbi:hypothetical protein HPP92_022555 [Vanilla planifolia]|uniref:Uncharacterized protein n=1 Tax=Vanilla planifolia TaxID=51239 RepID=A0A835PUB6_VANPL|nr:hypothetical protein HPP92_022555 [Vanilla planifolia]